TEQAPAWAARGATAATQAQELVGTAVQGGTAARLLTARADVVAAGVRREADRQKPDDHDIGLNQQKRLETGRCSSSSSSSGDRRRKCNKSSSNSSSSSSSSREQARQGEREAAAAAEKKKLERVRSTCGSVRSRKVIEEELNRGTRKKGRRGVESSSLSFSE
ncbi:hypothetical protein VYU27_008114, partial [Nannochloropsis oceanica]